MNTPIVGRIYHVVDKATGEVVKVGSTICMLSKRWRMYDKNKYSNHFLQEARVLQSSDLDWYEPKNPYCPFAWHLVAAEHIEIEKMKTFRNSRLSNQQSPLDQKYFGFDSQIGGSVGGLISGKKAFENKTGIHAPGVARLGALAQSKFSKSLGGKKSAENLTPEQRSQRSSKSCTRRNEIYGNPATFDSCSKGGKIGGKSNVQSGRLAYARSFYTTEQAKKNGLSTSHKRWHLNRGQMSLSCALCVGDS